LIYTADNFQQAKF